MGCLESATIASRDGPAKPQHYPGQLDADIRNFGLSVKHAAMPNLDIGAAFLRATIDTAGTDLDIDLIGLAAASDVTEQFSVFGGVSRTTLDLADLDGTMIRLGLTFPLGGAGTEASLNSVADSIFNPRRGALNAALTGAFRSEAKQDLRRAAGKPAALLLWGGPSAQFAACVTASRYLQCLRASH